MSGFPVQDSAGVCDRGCCAWDDDGSVTSYTPHLTCRYCGEDASDGFPVPAKAKEAAGRALQSFDKKILRQERYFQIAQIALEAGLPALAADPDLIERAARGVYDAHRERDPRLTPVVPTWDATDQATRDDYGQLVRDVLAALFGVASPSTKETQ